MIRARPYVLYGRSTLPHLTSPYKGEEKGWRPVRMYKRQACMRRSSL